MLECSHNGHSFDGGWQVLSHGTGMAAAGHDNAWMPSSQYSHFFQLMMYSMRMYSGTCLNIYVSSDYLQYRRDERRSGIIAIHFM